MSDPDEATIEHVVSVLENASGPLSPGRIQRRTAGEGRDVARRAVEAVCESLVEQGQRGSVTRHGPEAASSGAG